MGEGRRGERPSADQRYSRFANEAPILIDCALLLKTLALLTRRFEMQND